MNIVILDGFTANPGDLGWQRLESLGHLTVYDRTPESEIISRARDAEIVFTNKTPLDAATLEALPALRYVGVLATGFNVVDTEAALRRGVTVCNVPSYSTMSVAQNVFALILDITNSVAHYTAEVRDGKWSRCGDFCFVDTNLVELAGKRLGIMGFGAIGSKVAEIARAFGMEVWAFTSRPAEDIAPVRKCDLDTLFSQCDIITLHCPLTPSTFHIVNEERLAMMKPSAVLINTGRGPLVDEEELARALENGTIAAAGLDVLSQEPPEETNPLLKAPNCRITPHISWATREARKRLIEVAVSNLEAFLDGKPVNVVS